MMFLIILRLSRKCCHSTPLCHSSY